MVRQAIKSKYINKNSPIGRGGTEAIKLTVRRRILRWVFPLDSMVKVSRRRWGLSWDEKDDKEPAVWAARKESRGWPMQRPWGMRNFLGMEAVDFSHAHTDRMPLLVCLQLLFWLSVAVRVGVSVGSWMALPFWSINLKTSSQPVSYSLLTLPFSQDCPWHLCHSHPLAYVFASGLERLAADTKWTLKNYLLNFWMNFIRSSKIWFFFLLVVLPAYLS